MSVPDFFEKKKKFVQQPIIWWSKKICWNFCCNWLFGWQAIKRASGGTQLILNPDLVIIIIAIIII